MEMKPEIGSCSDRRMCGRCGESLREEALIALNRLWHPDHFCCASCKKPIKQTYQVANGAPYCVQCFAENFNPKCAGCGEVLVDMCLMALGKHWHSRCFACNLCRKPLPNGEYFLVDDKPYDKDCHWGKRLDSRTSMLKEHHVYP